MQSSPSERENQRYLCLKPCRSVGKVGKKRVVYVEREEEGWGESEEKERYIEVERIRERRKGRATEAFVEMERKGRRGPKGLLKSRGSAGGGPKWLLSRILLTEGALCHMLVVEL